MNPMNFLALKPSWEKFRTNHPKMISFVKTASRESFLDEGSLIEIKVTNSSGKTMAANIRVKKDDIEFLGGLKNALEKFPGVFFNIFSYIFLHFNEMYIFFDFYMVKFRYKILFYLKLPVGYHGSVRKEFLC